jgi:hypothetical protein
MAPNKNPGRDAGAFWLQPMPRDQYFATTGEALK